MHLRLIRLLILILATVASVSAYATHLRAAEIRVEQQCHTLTYKFYVTVYTNTATATLVHGLISYGDGKFFEIGNVASTPRPDLGQNVGVYTLELDHTYAFPNTYRVTYSERDRSRNILNIPDSEDVRYFTFTEFKADANLCNSTPELNAAPLDRACKGAAFFHSPAAEDVDGDSISYELTTPLQDEGTDVVGYLSPLAKVFYQQFDKANEAGNGPPTFGIDPVTGLLKWDAPGMQGPFNIAFKLIEWRRNASGDFVVISTTVRDMQIIVEDCLNTRPDVTIPADICVEAGTLLTAQITGTDRENHAVKIEVFSTLLNADPSEFPASISPADVAFRTSPDVISFSWQTDCKHVRDQAYPFVVKITDKPPGTNTPLVTFKTWNVRVIAPAPKWLVVEPDLVKRTAKLSWEGYTCSNAETIQIWRRVGPFPFTVGACEAGISKYRGYVMIKELDPSITEYTDTNEGKKLAMIATYCYRIVATFPAPAGGKSYVSVEQCVGPILADAPVITNVSVTATGTDDGAIQLKWLSPPDISKTNYPEPYEYEVYRASGFNGLSGVSNVSGRISSTTFNDVNVNTESGTSNYRIVLYSKTLNNPDFNAIDTSDVASGVFLTATPGEKKITLSWDADVPWSNVAPEDPTHSLYRKPGNASDDEYELIKSVDILAKGFLYTDSLLQDDDFFCYKIVTKGTYGNANIPMLFNNSQQVCAFPVNNLLPCAPLLTIDQTDCDALLDGSICSQDVIANKLQWQPQFTPGCRKDIVGYKVYKVNEKAPVIVADVNTTTWSDENILSYAFCYQVAAVDSKGHISPLSDEACNDNCPYYELPNVFSPNGDGCNDFFAAYGGSEQSSSSCEAIERQRCARFVKSVGLKIMNRWGREIYAYTSSDKNSIYINWNGHDKKGNALDAGVYYYVADVIFDTSDPKKRSKHIKGWVHLLN